MREVAQAQLHRESTLSKGRSIFMGLSAKSSMPAKEHVLKESSGIHSPGALLLSSLSDVPLPLLHARTSAAAALGS